MSELRWILLGLGVLLIAGLYFSARKPFPGFKPLVLRRRSRAAPPAPEPPETLEPPETSEPAAVPEEGAERPREPAPPRRGPEKVVTLRIVCRQDGDMSAEDAVLALKRFGLIHGRYGIFHRIPDSGGDEPLFSVASLTEPGSFDLDRLKDSTIAGLSLFLVMPGAGDPVSRFDSMIDLARNLAEDLDGIVLDERGSSWSIQRERYVREEIIQFHHQLSHG